MTSFLYPGGTTGTLRAMEDPQVLSFLKNSAEKAKFITSTCTGSLVLAAAGLLKGKTCTGHWAARQSLEAFGGRPVDARVVVDGQMVTGAGVSAGIDMAITVTRLLRGDAYAQGLMLMAEYAPEPPIPGGTPQTTEPRMRKMITDMLAPMDAKARAIAAKSPV
ncbi:DJ-1/PfpI family protein [Asticcacaulis excentricus]|uniref:DJ-1/PfpI family protein n=1 Tax=Asticcacaulis excentricus TaxID=78587 RepID=UPI000F833C6D|nr:DJ-1/PfpI family protein [Asticcacaulis excentricus]